MASILTEIYVSIDGLEYTKLDLYKDESLNIKYSKKDIQDISKVFAPFSQNFTIPATPKNKSALGFFGNTEVIKVNPKNEFSCKIYTRGVLNQKGLLKIESVKDKNKKADSFTVSFNTQFLSLKDRLGDDTLNDLTSVDNSISWKADNVKALLTNTTTTANNITTYIPLISNNRVWNYDTEIDEPSENYDNIVYDVSNNPRKDNVINIGELRPAINFLSIIDLIKDKYNLTITTPIEEQPQLSKLFMWCNGSNFARTQANKYILKKAFTNPFSSFLTTTSNLTDSSIKIVKDNSIRVVSFRFFLKTLIIGDDNDIGNVTITLVNKANNNIIIEWDTQCGNGDFFTKKTIPLALFESDEIEFYVYLKFDRPVFWRSSDITIYARRESIPAEVTSAFTNNINSTETGCHLLDLIQSLPDMKVLDFLQSYFKSFNISIYDSSPNNDDLFFLTPEDILTPNKSYTKREVDYSQYTDLKEVTKKSNNPYDYYTLKHKTSNYKSNSDFKKQFGNEYGQISYPLIRPEKPNEFKIETGFSIIPPVKINGSNVYTAYGFTAESPELINDNFFRYTPNLNEPTLFYSHGQEEIGATIFGFPVGGLGVQSVNSSDILFTSQLTRYVKSMPFCKENNYSLAFSVLRINDVDYPLSLFYNYYNDFISRLLNPNALSQVFTINLPASEIYLNDAGVVAGNDLTSRGFRLQNDIIIGETKYEILEANIDVTTGKGKFTLLNY